MHRGSLAGLLLCTLLLVVGVNVVVARPLAREICFPDQVPDCLPDPFAAYWEGNGGLPVFGYPIGPAAEAWSAEANRSLLTQWTERNRLESHPENAAPYNILLGRMGAERLVQLGQDPLGEGREAGPQAGCLWFEETGHNVCDQAAGLGFKSYWESHGLADPRMDSYQRSLALFGLPLTTARMEVNADDGQSYLTQWFERARFEWHPDKPDEFKVLLGLLGHELRAGGEPVATRPTATPGSETPNPTPSPDAPARPALSPVGGEINRGQVSNTARPAREAGVQWIRYNGILWSEVEATQGVRDWSSLAEVEAELRLLGEQNLTPVVIVRNTPEWARKVPGRACSAPTPEALDDFAGFMRDLVERYSAAPYNVRYWELGNEPDVDPSLVGEDLPFGCWGDKNDPYYGGGYYADILKQVYPAIKGADPNAQLIVGGLLLDCDPSNPPQGKDCTPGKFFEGMLRNGGGAVFDMVGYHAYTYWTGAQEDWDRNQASWKHRGGSLVGKLSFLREVMAQYGVNKPLLANEIGLLCYGDQSLCLAGSFRNDQSIYLLRTYIRAAANATSGAWYTLNAPGWRLGGLVGRRNDTAPAYQTLSVVGNLLNGAEYTGMLADGSSGLEGYAFRKGSTQYQVYWTNDGGNASVPLPANVRALYDKAGQSTAPGTGALTVSFEPVIVEIQP